MELNRIIREINAIVKRDSIILYYSQTKALDHRVNLHVSDLKTNGYMDRNANLSHRYNLGDYLGKVVVDWMLEKKNISLNSYVNKKKHLFTIGSGCVNSYQNMTFWGSGVERELPDFRRFFHRSWFRKLDIRAVRGPMTRDYLKSLGHECPEKYGDPAILMSLIYNGLNNDRRGKYDYSIIPQYVTEGRIREKYPEAHIISMNTDDYKTVIDQIIQSKLIISSSLHGIILAETYHIPAVFYRGLDKEIDFKYLDYYASTGRYNVRIAQSVEEALEMQPLPLPDLHPLQESLIDTFPYDLWDK